jgi:hypothetical protein
MSKDVALFISSASLGFVLRGLIDSLIRIHEHKRILRRIEQKDRK